MFLSSKHKKKVVCIKRKQVLLNLSRYLAEENLISKEEQLMMVRRIKEGYGEVDYGKK